MPIDNLMARVDVKEAVSAAKRYIADLYADEDIKNLGLEEIEYDDSKNIWNITLGFSRPWHSESDALTALGVEPVFRRSYKVVRLRGYDGRILSVKRREGME